MRIKWYFVMVILIGALLLISLMILAIIRPVNGIYLEPDVQCSCGHSIKYAVYNGTMIEVVEGHDSYRLYGHYWSNGGKNIGKYYRIDGEELKEEFELIPGALTMTIKRSFGNTKLWRLPVYDVHGYLSSKTYMMQGPVDPTTKRAIQLKMTFQEIRDWPNKSVKPSP